MFLIIYFAIVCVYTIICHWEILGQILQTSRECWEL